MVACNLKLSVSAPSGFYWMKFFTSFIGFKSALCHPPEMVEGTMHNQNHSPTDCSLSGDVVVITNGQCKVITTVMCGVVIILSDSIDTRVNIMP